MHNSGRTFRDAVDEQCKPPKLTVAIKSRRAIDLSCRACDACGAGAGCWAWIPGRGLRSAPFSNPNLRLMTGNSSLIARLGIPVLPDCKTARGMQTGSQA